MNLILLVAVLNLTITTSFRWDYSDRNLKCIQQRNIQINRIMSDSTQINTTDWKKGYTKTDSDKHAWTNVSTMLGWNVYRLTIKYSCDILNKLIVTLINKRISVQRRLTRVDKRKVNNSKYGVFITKTLSGVFSYVEQMIVESVDNGKWSTCSNPHTHIAAIEIKDLCARALFCWSTFLSWIFPGGLHLTDFRNCLIKLAL